MKFIKNILVMSMLLFFIGCTAWPILNPGPQAKKKTAIYPIPLPSTTTTAAVRIADKDLKALSSGSVPANGTLQLKAIDKDGGDISSTITWSSSTTSAATINSSGLVSGIAAGGETTITATHATLTPAATLKVTVTAAGSSVLAFDGKEFIQLNLESSQKASEEK